MKVARIKKSDKQLLDSRAGWWSDVDSEALTMMPAPLAMVKELSPFLANSKEHGVTTKLQVQTVHNGGVLAVKLRWASEKSDAITDLDQFVDGAAVLFPTVAQTSAITMGAVGKPVNGWYWRADKKKPYEIMAEGFRFVRRVPNNGGSDLTVDSHYEDGHWNIVFHRSLGARNKLVRFAPGKTSGIAFAVWSGANDERSGRKAFSGEFIPLQLS